MTFGRYIETNTYAIVRNSFRKMSDLFEGFDASITYVIGVFHIIFIVLYFLRLWLRGPTTGSDNPKRLDGKLVVITGK